MSLRYVEPQPITRREIEEGLASQHDHVVTETLIRMSLWESDWEWAENKCLTALKDSRQSVKRVGLTALGHLARRFQTLHLDVVLPAVRGFLDESDYRGYAEDALSDIAVFIPEPRNGLIVDARKGTQP
jgi:hypothetical protein